MVTLWAAVIVVFSDQLSKLWIRSSFVEEEIFVVIPGLFNITYIRNRGGAFGIFPHQPILFVVLTFITIAAIVYFYRRYRSGALAYRVAIGLVLGGAVGNLIDRLTFNRGGGVIDWLDFHLGGRHWPAFNIADSAICIGVFILLYYLIIKSDQQVADRAGSRTAED